MSQTVKRQQKSEPFERLNLGGERLGGFGVRKIAALRHVRHGQMLFDQPGYAVRIRGRKAEARAQAARDLGSGDRMVLAAAFGDIVQESRHVKRRAMADVGQDFAEQRMVLVEPPGFDLAQHPDRAQQMLVDRVMMVHRELHHADDAAEIRNETAEHARFVHSPERRLGRAARGEDFQEEPVGLGIGAQSCVDALQRLGDEPRRVRVNRQVGSVRDPIEPDQIDGVTLERVASDRIDAIVVDAKIHGVRHGARPASQAAEEAIEPLRRLGLALLHRRADDRGQVADVFSHQEIVFHEAFDVVLPGAHDVAQPFGDRPLQVEAEALLRAAGQKMQVAAHRPEEFLAAAKQREFPRRKQTGGDEFVRIPDAIDIFGDPEQRIEIAQAALSLLDVGLHEIARFAGALDSAHRAPRAWRRRIRTPSWRRSPCRIGREAARTAARRRSGTELENGCADRHVLARLLQALVERSRGVADLLLEVPEHVEHRLDDFLVSRVGPSGNRKSRSISEPGASRPRPYPPTATMVSRAEAAMPGWTNRLAISCSARMS